MFSHKGNKNSKKMDGQIINIIPLHNTKYFVLIIFEMIKIYSNFEDLKFFPRILFFFLFFFFAHQRIPREGTDKQRIRGGRIMATYENDLLAAFVKPISQGAVWKPWCIIDRAYRWAKWSNVSMPKAVAATYENVSNLANNAPRSLPLCQCYWTFLNPEKNNHNSPGTQLEFVARTYEPGI